MGPARFGRASERARSLWQKDAQQGCGRDVLHAARLADVIFGMPVLACGRGGIVQDGSRIAGAACIGLGVYVQVSIRLTLCICTRCIRHVKSARSRSSDAIESSALLVLYASCVVSTQVVSSGWLVLLTLHLTAPFGQ